MDGDRQRLDARPSGAGYFLRCVFIRQPLNVLLDGRDWHSPRASNFDALDLLLSDQLPGDCAPNAEHARHFDDGH
jgi:hypothetical protein